MDRRGCTLALGIAIGLSTAPGIVRAQDAGVAPPLDAGPEQPSDAGDSGTDRESDGEPTPPRLIESPDPRYPETHESIAIEPVVHLHVTVETDGTVSEAHVEHSGDPEFDRAAIEAVRSWRFEPARRGETPVRSRIRVAVRFRAPSEPPPLADEAPHAGREHDQGAHPDPEPAGDEVALHAPEDAAAEEASAPEASFGARASVDPIEESRRPRAASDYDIAGDVLQAAPHRDAADLLSSAPGVYVARPEGDAVAQHVFLRGFDAEHGQDIEFTLGGGVMPLNQPSHIHGQGYADLGFLVPEAVRRLRVTEGVYDPRQGDFATAGTIDFELGVERRGVQLRTTYGSYDTFRAVLLWAPEGEAEGTFATATFRQTSGFGANRNSMSGGVLTQWQVGSGALSGRVHASLWGARSQLAGFLRRDDVDAGRVDFLGVYDDPSARAQSALSARAHLGGVIEIRGDDGSFGEIAAYLLWSDFRLQANYTGYVERSRTHADWVGRGDLNEQRNEVLGLGLRARYRTRRLEIAEWLRGFVEVGLQSRLDSIAQDQSLLEVPQNQVWDRRADADVRALDAGAYVDLSLWITDAVRVRGGARADLLFYDVDDRLSNFIPDERPETYIMGYRRSALGIAAGPRATIEVVPIPELVLSVAYGEGYRSPQARQLQDGESAPFAKVRSGDAGFRLALFEPGALTIQGSAYLASVSDDTAFDPAEGRLEPIGPTTRLGGALYLVARPWSFLTASASATYVHATLDAPPRPTIENPAPAYRQGEALPFVPPWVLRADVSVGERLFDLAQMPFSGRIGLGFSFLSSRPLPYGLAADPVAVLDASATLRWSVAEIGVEILNLTDARYAATEYSYASSWSTSEVPSRLPARHFAAGAPLTVLVTAAVTL